MNPPCELLPWDSDFFGFRVARVVGGALDTATCGAVLEWCSKENVKLLYFLADDVASWAVAGDAGFRLVDIRIEMVRDHHSPPLPDATPLPGVVLREATASDVDELLPIAASSYPYSRFFADPAIPRERAGELFKSWLRRSVEGAIADFAFVAEIDGRPVSYMTASLKNGVANMGLLGVHPSARRRGIAQALVLRSLEWCEARGASEVTAFIQGRNIASLRLFQRFGFLSVATRLWFHRWFA